jgi:hypothetical protein
VGLSRELRDDESVVVTVTPLARGVLMPLALTALALAAAILMARQWAWPREHGWVPALVVLGPATVLGGRLARWRSRRIVLTNQRVIEVGGVLRRHGGSVELRDVHGSRLDQRLLERVARRGHVVLEMAGGTVALEAVRRPDALRRVIDHQRRLAGRRPEVAEATGERLRDTLDAGQLTDEDYDRRWRHLFGPDGTRG